MLNNHVLAFHPTKLSHRRPERVRRDALHQLFVARRWRTVVQETDAGNPPGLLRFGGKRRKSEADSNNDREPDPPHAYLRVESDWQESTEATPPPLEPDCSSTP